MLENISWDEIFISWPVCIAIVLGFFTIVSTFYERRENWKDNRKKKVWRMPIFMTIAMSIFAVLAAAYGNFGQIKADRESARHFENTDTIRNVTAQSLGLTNELKDTTKRIRELTDSVKDLTQLSLELALENREVYQKYSAVQNELLNQVTGAGSMPLIVAELFFHNGYFEFTQQINIKLINTGKYPIGNIAVTRYRVIRERFEPVDVFVPSLARGFDELLYSIPLEGYVIQELLPEFVEIEIKWKNIIYAATINIISKPVPDTDTKFSPQVSYTYKNTSYQDSATIVKAIMKDVQ